MGQQQLLLLVLSTVIVGLATVAGIQAFSENQAQASQDALLQRGTSIASDLQGAMAQPSQLGGITASADSSAAANAIGLGSAVVDAEGAGDGATCEIISGNKVQCSAPDANQDIQVLVQSDTLNTNIGSSNFD